MNNKEFQKIKKTLDELALGEMSAKQPAYTSHSKDVLNNFKRVAKRLGMSPIKTWAVYFNKHVDAINTYVISKDEAEPIETRFADLLNYLYLGMAIIEEKDPSKEDSSQDEMVMLSGHPYLYEGKEKI